MLKMSGYLNLAGIKLRTETSGLKFKYWIFTVSFVGPMQIIYMNMFHILKILMQVINEFY